MRVVEGNSTARFSLDSLQPEHIWTSWSEDVLSHFRVKIDGIHHPCISKGELWIGMCSCLSTLAFHFRWSCHHLTPLWIYWSWVCYTCNTAFVLVLPWVSTACTGLHLSPQHLHSVCLVAPLVISPWWRKHGLGTCLIVMLTVIKRHPWMRHNLLRCPLSHLANKYWKWHLIRKAGVFCLFGFGLCSVVF